MRRSFRNITRLKQSPNRVSISINLSDFKSIYAVKAEVSIDTLKANVRRIVLALFKILGKHPQIRYRY